MPPPPLKVLKPTTSNKEQTIEQLLQECGFSETLEVFRKEWGKRSRVGVHEEPIEKKGDLWTCNFCDKTFTTKGSAKRHLTSAHAIDSKQFSCSKCGSRFARRDDLYTHLRRMHGANDLVESMIEEHKQELKGEHKGPGKGQLMSVMSHNKHLDVILPSGDTICRPFSTEVSANVAKEPVKAAKACKAPRCNHWRVLHDGHEDVLVNGALHHKNEDGDWECHGELGSFEDFEFLLSTAQFVEESIDDSSTSTGSASQNRHDCPGKSAGIQNVNQDFSLEDFDFFLGNNNQESASAKKPMESLILPGGSVICRHAATSTPVTVPVEDDHTHSTNCGHSRVRHGNHYDFIIGNIIDSESENCAMHGVPVLEQVDSSILSQVISALSEDTN